MRERRLHIWNWQLCLANLHEDASLSKSKFLDGGECENSSARKLKTSLVDGGEWGFDLRNCLSHGEQVGSMMVHLNTVSMMTDLIGTATLFSVEPEPEREKKGGKEER